MDNIELVIKMPENDYKAYINHENYNEGRFVRLLTSVINGTLLPKGHGRLIDADKLKEDIGYTGYNYDFQNCLDDAPTIIEAESEG